MCVQISQSLTDTGLGFFCLHLTKYLSKKASEYITQLPLILYTISSVKSVLHKICSLPHYLLVIGGQSEEREAN